jgi:serine/threonine protein phosphatase PrpC
MLLACDGLWDVMSAEAAFEYLHSHAAADSPQRAVHELVQAAEVEYHSQDNITAVYVRLSSPTAAKA